MKTAKEIKIKTETVVCAGDENSEHPNVYLRIKDKFVCCPYCGTKYDLINTNPECL